MSISSANKSKKENSMAAIRILKEIQRAVAFRSYDAVINRAQVEQTVLHYSYLFHSSNS
jgi:hypothetical protein